MTNTQTEKPKGVAYREIMHSPNLSKFYSGIWGNYHENKIKIEREATKGVDRVLVGLGLSALALNSCASFEDVSAPLPEAFQRAYEPKETPAQLEAKVAGMKKKVEDLKGVNDSLDELTSVASGETTAEVGVPQKTVNTTYNELGLLIAGGVLLGGIVATYILWPPKNKQNKYQKSNPPETSPEGNKLRETLNERLHRKNPPTNTEVQ